MLTTSYKYSNYNNGQNNDITTANEINYASPAYNQYNNSGAQEHTIQLDYVQPIKKLTIEAGAKAIVRKNFSESDAQVEQTVNGTGVFYQ